MLSYWEKKYWFEPMDFTIVGSGLVGLLSAIYISKKYPKARIGIIERTAVPSGASTKNAGFACFGSVGELLDDMSTIDQEAIISTLRMRYEGLQLLSQTVPSQYMDYKPVGGYEIFQDKSQFEKCAAAIPAMNKLVAEAIGIKDTFKIQANSLQGESYSELILNPYEGQLNPVKLIAALRKQAQRQGIEIHSGFSVREWKKSNGQIDIAFSDSDLTLQTQKLILATNAFTQELISDLDIQPKRNQVLISHPLKSTFKGTYHFDRGFVYFRNIDDRILIGGARNLDPKTESTSITGRNQKLITHLIDFAQRNINKNFKMDQQWSGIIATGKSKAPLVKYVEEDVFVAARMGGMGVAIGAQVAQQVTDLI